MAEQGGAERGPSPVEVSRNVLVVGVALVAFLSALGGAMLALALDDPDVVETERVVEVDRQDPLIELAEADVVELADQLETLVGVEFDSSEGLVHELGVMCNRHDGPTEADRTWLVQELEQQLPVIPLPGQAELDSFLNDVRAACPS